MQRFFLVLLFISNIAGITPSYATEDAKICPSGSSFIEHQVQSKMATYRRSFKADKQTFFAGLWSKIEPREKQRLSKQLHKSDKQMLLGLKSTMQKLSARLMQDRQQLAAWVAKNGLAQDIEVQTLPADGSFLLIKTTKKGIGQILCASYSGELDSVFSNLGY